MSDPEQDQHRAWEEGGPERLYVITSGRQVPERHSSLDMVTLIVSRNEPGPGMQPELAAIVRICGYPLSVAELSAYLHLPVSVITVLLTDLLASGHVEARASALTQSLPDVELLEAVMHGLQNL
ncbi:MULTISPECIES: DUF742 domain-containing protein [Streptomyces]|uniref:DUF742 domain-containing protein n=1 Tax=Streptomyces TaxID=1883 RepID=UPI0004ABB4C4|nr:DUF742 domain-containing protein [Streptomyces monomycini]